MKKCIVALLLMTMMLATTQLFAVSEAAVLFLMISPGARAAGMGEAFVAVADDATASYWNPAGLAYTEGRELTIMHANWLPQLVTDMYFDYIGFRQYSKTLGGTIGGNITFLNLGENVWTDEGANELGRFNSYDMALTLSYGTMVGKNTGLGVSMRYIRSMLAPDWVQVGTQQGSGSATAFSVDLGVIQAIPFVKGLSFGANLSNMGPKITYVQSDQADPLPTNLKMGFSYKLIDSEFNKLRLTMDTNKMMIYKYWSHSQDGTKIDQEEFNDLSDDDKEYYESKSDPFYKAIFSSWTDGPLGDQFNRMISSIGAEYIYNNMIAIRGGYYYDKEGQVKYPSFGAGLTYNMFQFDFAYVAAETGHPLSDTMRFSLSAKF